MIWTEKENAIRTIDNMLNRGDKTCTGCRWCNHEKGKEYFTCGHHLENFTPDSYCSYWTNPKDKKLLAYYDKRKVELKAKFKKIIKF